jgi:hypothetical protein
MSFCGPQGGEVLKDDDDVARGRAVLSAESIDLLVVVTRGVWAHNKEPTRLEGLLKAVEALS